jgi:hypothetical protein
VWVRRPHARTASAARLDAGSTTTASSPSSGVGAADAAAAAEAAGHRDDDLPRLAAEALGAVDLDPAGQRPPGQRGARRADGVGQRPEARLERLGPAGRDRGQAGARDVDERAPAGQAAELELGPRGARRGQGARLAEVEGERVDPREVVRGARGEHGERDPRLAGRGGARRDAAAAADRDGRAHPLAAT